MSSEDNFKILKQFLIEFFKTLTRLQINILRTLRFLYYYFE